MRALLDESVPQLSARALSERGEAVTAFPLVWKGLQNGELLDRIETEGFDFLITCDKNLRFQQSFRNRNVGVLVLPFQRLDQLLPIAARIAEALKQSKGRSIILIARDGSYKVEPLV